MSRGSRHRTGHDDEGNREAKLRRLEGGDHSGVDPRRASRTGPAVTLPPVEANVWPPDYTPSIHAVVYGAHHAAVPHAAQETLRRPPDKSTQVQYFYAFPSQSVPVSGQFSVSDPTIIPPSSFSAGDAPSNFLPAAPQPSGDVHGFWHPVPVGPPMFNTGFERTAPFAEFPIPAESPRTDGLPVCDHTWTQALPPSVSMGDYRQLTTMRTCYMPTAPAGHTQSSFPPSPFESTGVSANSSPYPRTPGNSAFSYVRYGSLLQTSHDSYTPSVVTTDQAPEAGFSFQPIDALAPPETARVSGFDTPPSPQSEDNVEVKYRSPSPPDPRERWATTCSVQTKHDVEEHEAQDQVRLGRVDADSSQELAQNDRTPTVPESAPRPRPRHKSQRPLAADARSRICETRRMGACLRCHNQRAKVRISNVLTLGVLTSQV
jgi:hypothetical protein